MCTLINNGRSENFTNQDSEVPDNPSSIFVALKTIFAVNVVD